MKCFFHLSFSRHMEQFWYIWWLQVMSWRSNVDKMWHDILWIFRDRDGLYLSNRSLVAFSGMDCYLCKYWFFLVSGPGRSQFLQRKTQISLKVTRWNRVGSYISQKLTGKVHNSWDDIDLVIEKFLSQKFTFR